MSANESILAYEESGPFDQWVAQSNPGRLPFVQPRADVPDHSDDGSHHLKWTLWLSAIAKNRDGSVEYYYWHSHPVIARNKTEAIESAQWLIDRHPALLNFQ